MVGESRDTLVARASRYGGLGRIGAGLVAVAGLFALFAWADHTPALASLTPGQAPTGPASAALFLIFSVAILTHLELPDRRWATFTGTLLVAVGTAAAFALLVVSVRVPGGTLPSRLEPSPVASGLFVLAGASYLASWRAKTGATSWALTGWWLACALLAAGIALVLGHLYGGFFITGTQIVTPSALSSVAFIALAAGLIGLAGATARRAPGEGVVVPRVGVAFGAVSVLIVVVSYLSYGQYQRQYLVEVEHQLAVIADLKAGEVVQFRRERRADADLLFRNAEFRQTLVRFLAAQDDAEAERQLTGWLSAVAAHHSYDRIFVTDEKAIVRDTLPRESATDARLGQAVTRALEAKEVAFVDLYRNGDDGQVYAGMVVPILDPRERPIGAVAMRFDPRASLFPLLKRWPTDSRTAETVLVRREGDQIVFLSELRLGHEPAVLRRLPVSQTDVVAVKAVLQPAGVVEGVDFRGVPVLAAVRPVPDSPWYLIARMDLAEVRAPLRMRLWLVLTLTGSLLLGGWMALSWWQERARFVAERAAFSGTQQKTNELLAHIFDEAHFGLVSLDRDFNIIRVNRAYAQAFGQPPDFFPGKNLFAVTPHEENERLFRRVVQTGEPFTRFAGTLNLPGRPERGPTYWDWTLHPLKDARGQVDGLLFVLLDVTERQKSEQALRQSAEGLKEAERRASLGNWEIDHRRDVSRWSDETFRILELDPATTTPSFDAFVATIHPDDRERVLQAFQSSMRDRTPYDLIHRLKMSDGRVKYVSGRGETSVDSEGKPVRSVGTIQDITERRRLEEQLRQAQRMESIGLLAGGIAHDFNNMLTAIIGYGTMLKMAMPPESPLLSDVEEILAAGDRAAQLTRSLLAFSRKQIMDLKPLEVNDLVRRMAKLLRRVIGEQIELETLLSDERLQVLADQAQLEQAMVNLATNARDAMPRGGRLTIRTAPIHLDEAWVAAHGTGKPGDYVMVTLADTGLGMDAETRAKIFEPFFTTKEVGRGTGLGLSMVYGTVTQQGGFITVYSEPNRGTTFQLYLPLAAATPKAVERPSEPALVGGTETILVAEDDPALRRLAATLLSDFGYTVILAEDGEDALAKFKAHADQIRLLLFDVIMPKMNGKDAWEEIRKLRPGVKAIFVSGYTADAVQSKEFAAEGLTFVPKPISPRRLLATVREALDARAPASRTG